MELLQRKFSLMLLVLVIGCVQQGFCGPEISTHDSAANHIEDASAPIDQAQEASLTGDQNVTQETSPTSDQEVTQETSPTNDKKVDKETSTNIENIKQEGDKIIEKLSTVTAAQEKILAFFKFTIFGLQSDLYEVLSLTVYSIGIAIDAIVIFLYKKTKNIGVPAAAATKESLDELDETLDNIPLISSRIDAIYNSLNQVLARQSIKRNDQSITDEQKASFYKPIIPSKHKPTTNEDPNNNQHDDNNNQNWPATRALK